MHLSPLRFGLAAGSTLGLGIFAITLIAVAQGQTDLFFELLKIYPGYGVSLQGAALGFLWAFIDGFFGGYLLAWLYNGFGRCGHRTVCCNAERCADCNACQDCGQMTCNACEDDTHSASRSKKKKSTKKSGKKTTTKKKTDKKD